RSRWFTHSEAHGADMWGEELQSGRTWGIMAARKQAGVAGLLPLRDSGRISGTGLVLFRVPPGKKTSGIQGPFRVLARREEPPNNPGKVQSFVLWRPSPREVARSLCLDLHPVGVRQLPLELSSGHAPTQRRPPQAHPLLQRRLLRRRPR